MTNTKRLVGIAVASLLSNHAAKAADQVTFASLLSQLGNLDVLAEYPGTQVTTGQPDSTCLASLVNDWYCNTDWNQFARQETNQGRTEQVMMDVLGPGAITRIWIGGPDHGAANIRFYFDGSTTPQITQNLDALMMGQSFVKSPFVYQAGPALTQPPGPAPAGLNLMIPIPFAQRLKVTYDGPITANDPRLYYNVEYRHFAPGTSTQSFAESQYSNNTTLLSTVASRLSPISSPTSTADSYGSAPKSGSVSWSLAAGKGSTLSLPAGSNAVRLLNLVVSDTSVAALASLQLTMTFDGEQTVSSPVGDFFGSGLGFNPGTTETQSVGSTDSLSSRWTMPYQKSGSITLTNTGASTINVTMGLAVGAYGWDGASMHFHSVFKDTGPFSAADHQDSRYLEVFGSGVLVGDTQTNIQQQGSLNEYSWWGEGDEKIYVDTLGVPTHFGTGQEDYYGYSYGHTTKFQSPWNSQAVAPPGLFAYNGNTVLNRSRLLDAIPFSSFVRFDNEFWAWNPGSTDEFRHVAFFYALPEAAVVAADALVSGQTYIIQSKVAGWNLDVTDGSTQSGALIQDYLPNGSTAQQWQISSAGNGYFTIQSVISGYYLDVPNASMDDAVQLQQFKYDGTCAQLWKFTPTTNNFYTITNQCSGKDVDVFNASIAPGTQVNQYHSDSTSAQEWKLARTTQ